MLTAAHEAPKPCLPSTRSLGTGAPGGGSQWIRWREEQLALVNLGTMKMCNEPSQSERLTVQSRGK